jgi:hypothetical protein
MITLIDALISLAIKHAYDMAMLILVCGQTLFAYLSLRPSKTRKLRFKPLLPINNKETTDKK